MGKREAIARHFARQKELLRMEFDYEKSEYRRQTEAAGVARNVARGRCWYPVRLGRSYYNSLNHFVVEVLRGYDAEESGVFESGMQVSFFHERFDGVVVYEDFLATVSYVDGGRMVVALPSEAALAELGSLGEPGVDVAFDETSYRTMSEAVAAAATARDSRLSELVDVVCGFSAPRFRELPRVSFPWLNGSQENAVNKVLCSKDVMVVHGPPGTGKTTTLVEAICETLRREAQVLVCAQSNMAVDWICGKLSERGVGVLRVGNPVRVNDRMLSQTYERQFEAHPDYPELWSVRRAIREVSGRRRASRGNEAVANRLDKLRRRASELEVKIQSELFGRARVVAATLVGCGGRLLYGRRFSTLFIDEAGQALEAASWIGVGKADRVVLAGDHCQLPPTVKCPEAERGGLSRSLLEVIAERCPEAVALLTVQYRMNEAIMRFPSDWFYGGKLTAAREVRDRSVLDFDCPMEWVDTSGLGFDEQFVAVSGGRVNPGEGRFFLQWLERYVERIGLRRIVDDNIDFALISPYKAQVGWIAGHLKKSALLRPLRGRLTVDTIDGFQGQERDVVLVSLVRSNDDGRIGFLSDLRRINVAITRARMKLVIFGSAATMCGERFYRDLFRYVSGLR